MMRILIIEDEAPATAELTAVLKELNPATVIVEVLQTTKDVKLRLASFAGRIDLIFMDIQLHGENILDILQDLSIPAPIIFVTAYDEYIQNALQYTSLDYILKPINKEKVHKGLEKYVSIKNYFMQDLNPAKLLTTTQKKNRSRILLKKGTDFHFCRTEEVAYFFSDFKLVFLMDFGEQKHLTDIKTLTILQEELDPSVFYRVNRKFIVNINAIKKIRPLDRVKLSVDLKVRVPEEIIVSQENASSFKNWIASKEEQ